MKRTVFLSALLGCIAAASAGASGVESTSISAFSYDSSSPVNPASALNPDTAAPAADFSVLYNDSLALDVYMPKDTLDLHYCVIYAYGGGFFECNLKDKLTVAFCRALADAGYVAVAMDYRLGLRGVKMKTKLGMVAPLRRAVDMASDDMISAVAYVASHAPELRVRPDGIVVSGSSAGAITSLQTEYKLCSTSVPAAYGLPVGFRLAGVMSFAGAAFSSDGRVRFRTSAPAPTLLMHGTKDNIVTYKKIAFGPMRFSGSSDLVKSFERGGYPYCFVRFVGEGHGVALRMKSVMPEILWFLDEMVAGGRFFQIDKTVFDRDYPRPSWDHLSAKALY